MRRALFAALAASSLFCFSSIAGANPCPSLPEVWQEMPQVEVVAFCTPVLTDYADEDAYYAAVEANGIGFRDVGADNSEVPHLEYLMGNSPGRRTGTWHDTVDKTVIYGRNDSLRYQIVVSADLGLPFNAEILIPDVPVENSDGTMFTPYYTIKEPSFGKSVANNQVRIWAGEGKNACKIAEELPRMVSICVR